MLALGMLAGLIGLTAFLQPDTASADQAKFYLDCPTSEVREGGDVDVFLVRVTNHQHGVTFGAYWHTDAGTAGTDDYVHQDTGAIWSNESERLANRAKRTFRTREDALVEGNETFTARFSPVDNVVDRDDPTRDEKCEITIVDDDPNITGIEVISDPARDNNTYGVGETIEIEATFSTSVDVDGNPGLGLSVGSNWRSASYLRGSGSDTLVFGYTVKADDRDSDGIKMDGGYQDSSGTWHNLLNHTAITATGTGTVAYRVYAGIGDQSDHKVDGSLTPVGIRTEITSSPESGDTYRYGETIDFSITFSGLLEVDGSRHLSLRVGSDDAGGWRGATYQSGSGTNTLVFGYTVQTGDLDDDGVTMLGTWVEGGAVHGLGGSGTVTVEGTDIAVTPTFTGLSNQSGHQLDGRPYPRSISITSSPMSKSDTYGRDEVIQVSVNFDQNVTARGGAVAILRMGYGWRQRIAPYVSGNGTDTLAFEYKVVEEDIDENGVDAFLLHGRDIRATGTDIAYQPNPGGVTPQTGDDSDHKVDGSLVTLDTTSPTVSSVEITSDPGDDDTYGRGDWVAVLVTFSESVLVTGEPLLELNIGGVARTAEYGLLPDGTIIDENSKRTPHSKVSFGYTVREGDVDTDGISIGADRLTLNGGAIRDEANNDAVLTHDAVDAYYGHRVNAPDVTAPTVSSVEITSDPGDDDTYGTGDSIEVTVTFSEDVTVDGLIELELDIGGAAPHCRELRRRRRRSGLQLRHSLRRQRLRRHRHWRQQAVHQRRDHPGRLG